MILLLAALASATEYRRVELSDGRFLIVEILGNDETGVDVAVPQGRMRLSFDRVIQLQRVEEAQYRAQPPLRVLVLPFTAADGAPAALAEAARERVWAALGTMPAVERRAVSDMGGYAPASTLNALAGCGADTACVGARVASLDVDVVIAGTVRGTGAEDLALVAAWPLYTDVRTLVAGRVGPDGTPPELAWRLTHAALGLLPSPYPASAAPEPAPWGGSPPAVAPPEVTPAPVADSGGTPAAPPVASPASPPAPAAAPASRASRVIRPGLAWVPFPGFAQWVGGDPGRALGATAVVLPGTAGLVYLSGASTTREPEAIALSALGYWGLCVVTGRAFVPVAVPTAEGGLRLGAAGRF